MMIREKIRASLIRGTLFATGAKLDYTQRSKASCGVSRRFSPEFRYDLLIYGSAIKTSHKPQQISYLRISNRRFRQRLAYGQAMLSASLQHFSFHGIIGFLCSQ
jgi:hypothetical protein